MNPKVEDRKIPQSLEAEVSILGSILFDNNVLPKVMEHIKRDDFYSEQNALIFEAMSELFSHGKPVDLVTVSESLDKKGLLDRVGGALYLSQIADSAPPGINVEQYIKIVREKAVLRRLIRSCSEIIVKSCEQRGEVDEILDEAERSIFEIAQERVTPSFYHIKEILKTSFQTLSTLYEKKERITGIPSGFSDLDRLTAGFQNSDLVIIAGRPSMGKTSFCLNIAEYVACKKNIPVGIFSLEMSKEQICLRLLCSMARVDSSKARSGFLSPSEWERLTDAASSLSESPIYVDDTPAISVMEMRAKARRLRSENSIGILFVDYLQLMKGMGFSERREQEISEISRSLKALAKELNIPVIALSQLNRKVEDRHDKRPQLADLRESGAIEQDADLIMFIYRDEVYNRSENNPNKGVAEIIVGKHRNGPTGVVKLAFLDKFTRFENLSHVEYEVDQEREGGLG